MKSIQFLAKPEVPTTKIFRRFPVQSLTLNSVPPNRIETENAGQVQTLHPACRSLRKERWVDPERKKLIEGNGTPRHGGLPELADNLDR
jgi:hypothetical protein